MVLPESAVILLAEDRPDDVKLIQMALAKAGVFNPLLFVPDGEQALAYLDGIGKYCDRKLYPLPDILLLDLKMPKVDGFEVLQEIKKRPQLQFIRILVLTSSQEMADVNRAYALGANSFLVKPLEFENYTALMRTLSSFWLHANRFAQIAPAAANAKSPPPANPNSPRV